MHRLFRLLDPMMNDTPAHIYAWMAAGVTSAFNLTILAIESFLAQMPNGIPSTTEANQWPFYGVLLVAIIVLFSSLAVVLRFIANRLLVVVDANTAAMKENTASNGKVIEALDKQIDYFDDLGKDAIHSALTNSPNTPSNPPTVRRPKNNDRP